MVWMSEIAARCAGRVNGGLKPTLNGGISQEYGMSSILTDWFGMIDTDDVSVMGAYRKEPVGRVQIRPRRDAVQEGETQLR
jgi:NADPH-dependent 7-cyano-7-deazaguanine reductase QueF